MLDLRAVRQTMYLEEGVRYQQQGLDQSDGSCRISFPHIWESVQLAARRAGNKMCSPIHTGAILITTEVVVYLLLRPLPLCPPLRQTERGILEERLRIRYQNGSELTINGSTLTINGISALLGGRGCGVGSGGGSQTGRSLQPPPDLGNLRYSIWSLTIELRG